MEAERERQKPMERFGARKMWLRLRSKGHEVARCMIERLFAEHGWTRPEYANWIERTAMAELLGDTSKEA